MGSTPTARTAHNNVRIPDTERSSEEMPLTATSQNPTTAAEIPSRKVPTMPNSTANANMPAHLEGSIAGAPRMSPVFNWTIFKDYRSVIEAHVQRSGRTRETLQPFVDGSVIQAEEYRAKLGVFDPMEPHRLNRGRAIYAHIEAVRASLPSGPRWAAVAQLTLDGAIDALRLPSHIRGGRSRHA